MPRRSARAPSAPRRGWRPRYARPCASRGRAPSHPAGRAHAPRCPSQSPGTTRTSSVTRSPLSLSRLDHAVSRITLVLALEAQLPTGCHSRSTSSRRTSGRGAHRRRPRRALSTRWPSSHHAHERARTACGSCRSRGRQDTRPPLLGKRRERVSHSYHKALLLITMREENKWYKVTDLAGSRHREPGEACSRAVERFAEPPGCRREISRSDHVEVATGLRTASSRG